MPNRTLFPLVASVLVVFPVFASSANAQKRDVPYWATIKTDQLNMRVGPSREFKIQWVYQRKGLPIKIIRVVEAWRLIEDSDGAQGWVSANLLSADRGALVTGEGMAAMRDTPSLTGSLKWNLEPGVVGKLGDCEAEWCVFEVAGHIGYVMQDRLWGAEDLGT